MIARGTTLQDRYIIERLIGEGGMGAVYLGRQVSLNDRPVAIKHMTMPLSAPADQERAAAQFQQEASTLATLRHPNLVTVHDFFSEGSSYYIVMEYVEGQTLDTVIQRSSGGLEMDRVIRWGQELCDVLAYLHGHHPPIIFRDLKPANIMLDRIGHLRLIDFGIAKSFQLQSATSTFIIGAGTPGYAAPEQYGTATVDARTDVYALGAVLYTLLTGQAPCDAIDRVLGRASLVPLTRLNPDLPAALGGAVEKMMALQPEDRFASVAETRDALSALGERAERLRAAPPPPPVPLEPSGDSPWLSFAVVILVLAGLAGLLIRLDHNRPRAEVGHAPPVLPAPTAPPSQSPESTPEASPSPSATPSPSPSDVASPSPVARASSSASPAALLPGIASTGDIVTTDSGLMYQDIKVGEGPIPTPGDTVKVEYTAWLMNGKKVDSTVDRGKPFEFVLGTGQVIKGWDEGVSTMHVGGRRKLIIPASLGYGASGAPPAIPPGATLILDLEVLSTQPPP